MSTACTCKLHQQLEVRQSENARHACYRQLARTILGPAAPHGDAELARALANHARLMSPQSNVLRLIDRRAA